MIASSLALCAAALGLATLSNAEAASWQPVQVKGSYTGRSDSDFSRCGTSFCLLGGRNGDGGVIKPADVFDPSTSTWTPGSPPPVELHHFQMAPDPTAPDGDCVWVGGAWDGFFPKEGTVNRTYTYCAGDDKWGNGPVIPRPRGAGGAVTYDGKYYLVGGNVGGHGQGEVVPYFDVYDPKTQKWTKLDDVPNPRDHFFATVIDGKLIVAGGRDGSVKNFFDAVTPEVDVYDFQKESWETIDATFPTPRGGALASEHAGGAVYGGGESSKKAFDDFHFFDGESFVKAPPMLTPHHGTGYASCGGALFSASGVSESGADPEILSTEVFMVGTDVPACKKGGFESPDASFGALLGGEEEFEEAKRASGGKSGGEDDPECFPADASVELESGASVSMAVLELGDRVRVADGSFSDVYLFSHRNAKAVSQFIRISTARASLSLTPGHLLVVNGKLAAARSVKVGDSVAVLEPGSKRRAKVSTVKAVAMHKGRGLYNPHTLEGTLVVNGVVTSCLTEALPSSVASLLLKPFEFAYEVLGAGHAINSCNEAVLFGISRIGRRQNSIIRFSRYLASAWDGLSEKVEL